jgi:2-C-methyl-D-erythritol 4-phosphate cytidylyltransferase
MKNRYLLIMAGGLGLRMGGDLPKQLMLLDGRPIIFHTIDRFLEYDPNIKIVIVLPEKFLDGWISLCDQYGFKNNHTVCSGGDERFHSVKNGLKMTRGDSLIAIHDSVRPLVSIKTITNCFDMASQKGNAIPVINTQESVREVGTAENDSRPLERSTIRLVQTPQVFSSELLFKAYNCEYSPHFTDDATVVEGLGVKINLVEGNRENIKITTPEDLLLAETLIKTTTLKK